MIDLQKERLFSLTEATKILPSRPNGKRFTVATLFRWAMKGMRGTKLETILVGRCRCTSWEALGRFLDATNKDREERALASLDVDLGHPDNLRTKPRRSKELHRRDELDEGELITAGI